MTQFTPLADHYHLRQIPPAVATAGGVHLPEITLHVTNEAEVVAAGPGLRIPETNARPPMQAEPGDRIVYLAPDWVPTGDGEGTLTDDQLVGVVMEGTGEVEPLNDWVKLVNPARARHSRGGLALPDMAQKANPAALVLAVGPGKRRLKGPLFGTRKAVSDIVNQRETIIGRVAWWSRQEETLALVQPSGVACMFVRADMLMAVEE